MRISRHYIGDTSAEGELLTLDRHTSHYLSNVLRAKAGQQIKVFDGLGNEHLAEVTSIDKKQTTLRLLERLPTIAESKLSISLGIGISKGERMDWVIQKSTELGVQNITPLFTERAELKIKADRLQKKMQHWRQITISACEQCNRAYLPIIHEPQALSDWVENLQAEKKYVLHHRSEDKLNTQSTVKNIGLLIGPEGGLSKQEINLSQEKKFKPLGLGPRILRTETAPVAAVAILQYLWGDMG